MRKYETKPITKTERIITSTTCDICGTEFEDASEYGDWPIKPNGEHYFYPKATCTVVKMHWFDGEDEDCLGEKIFDICPKCFESQLIPWIKSHAIERKQINDAAEK